MSNDQNSNNTSGGIGFLGLLFLVFLVLKLGVGNTAVVNWSWLWVTAPLWGGFALFLAIVAIVIIIALIVSVLK